MLANREGKFIGEVLPDIFRIDIPLPQNPLGTINCYLIRGNGRFLLVDTGMDLTPCLEAMQSGMAEVGATPETMDFFITHYHIDHLGLLPRLVSHNSVVYFSKTEAALLSAGVSPMALDFALKNGFPEEEILKIAALGQNRPPQAQVDLSRLNLSLVEDDSRIKIGDYTFVCLETPGHSPGHVCLYEPREKILFAGDHILDVTTPNIMSWSDQDNSLMCYLSGLDKIERLEVAVILPGHGPAFDNHRRRIGELKRHHKERLEEILSMIHDGALSGYEIASRMSWDVDYGSWENFPAFEKMFAFGEALAHLKYLEGRDLVHKTLREDCFVYQLT